MEKSPGGPGRPELWCVGSVGGLSVHLFDAGSRAVMCRGLRGDHVVIDPNLPPFELCGCKRCAAAAVKAGYEVVVTNEGERISLDGFEPIA